MLEPDLIVDLADEDDPRGRVLGVPAYMSPEQAQAAPLGPPSDWYSVGVMLYEALTGELPYEGDIRTIMLGEQAYDAPDPRSRAAGIADDLAELCLGLLARDPRKRPNGTAILRALGGSAEGAPPELRRDSGEATWEITLDVDFTNISQAQVAAIVDRIRALTANDEIHLVAMRPGSVVLKLRGSHEAYVVLAALHKNGQFRGVAGIPVLGLKWVDDGCHSALALPGDLDGVPVTPPVATPTRPSLRKLLGAVLRSDADLDAFCFDYFTRTHSRFSSGMSRVEKTTLLMQCEDPCAVFARLREHDAAAVAGNEGLLQYE
jgi:hypothetical protein